MSGTTSGTKTNSATGSSLIDGLLASESWNEATLFYSMPRYKTEYGSTYGQGEQNGFFPTNAAIDKVIDFALNVQTGTAADDGFSFEGFTAQDVVFTTAPDATLRVAQTWLDPFWSGTAWGYFPGRGQESGDVWFSNVLHDYSAPVAGDYANLTIMHELGHALGLDHSHAAGSFGVVDIQFDSMEYTLMSYRAYQGAPVTAGYPNEAFGFAQSYMMLDIQALQYMYGADFTTNSGDTTYAWTPYSGDTMVNGVAAILPGANRIFATIWDGGGVDTYDLSAYTSDLKIDLAPGGFSLFSATQQVALGAGNKAQGNIYNALQYLDDARSLIENAIGGAGKDYIRGNQADNNLIGNGANDKLFGLSGSDTLKGGTGRDIIKGGANNDTLMGNYGGDKLFGNGGKDTLKGGAGNDRLTGGGGKDILTGGKGADEFRFVKASDSKTGGASDVIRDFKVGVDKINLSALSATPFTFDVEFSGTGPSVTTSQRATKLFVLVDVDGDAVADMRIVLDDVTGLSASDFIL